MKQAFKENKKGEFSKMGSNDLIILRQVLDQDKSERFPLLTASNHFEIFVTEQIVKNFDLSYEEIEAGITGGGNDGGIDSMFTFVNGQLLFEDTDLTAYKKAITIEVFITQTKKSEGFEGSALDKINVTLKEILDLNKDLSSMGGVYDAKLLQAVGYFRRAYKQLASKFPDVNLMISYASLGDTDEQIHSNVRRKADILGSEIKDLLPHCEPVFTFYGAKELLDLARKKPTTTIDVNLFDNIAGKEAYLCLINLKDYYNFIIDDKRILRKHIFETNVRDYQGKVEVNEGIKSTLESDAGEDFWWLNNGVTIIAAHATISGKTMSLEDPQVVNGLQTSTEIFVYFKMNPKAQETRSVLVKIIVTTSSNSQEKIIRATNSQTNVPLASLKATDKIQRDIEDHFRHNDLYYDRRKNYYKNLNIQRDKIISIAYLAQAVMSIVLQEPNEARARPSSILKKDLDYKKIFNILYPLNLYLNCIKIMRLVDDYIKNDKAFAATEEKNNLRFHFALYLVLSVVGHKNNKREDIIENIVKINLSDIDSELLNDKWQEIIYIFQGYRFANTKISPDSIGKSKEFVEVLLNKFPMEDLRKRSK